MFRAQAFRRYDEPLGPTEEEILKKVQEMAVLMIERTQQTNACINALQSLKGKTVEIFDETLQIIKLKDSEESPSQSPQSDRKRSQSLFTPFLSN